MKFTTKFIIGALVAIAVFLVIYFSSSHFTGLAVKSSQYDSFAQCLSDKGMKLYGAYWCPHCQDQKAMFGSSVKYINYVECSLPNDAGETQVCSAAGIQSYPTWQMPDGSMRPGVLTLQELSALSGCQLPS